MPGVVYVALDSNPGGCAPFFSERFFPDLAFHGVRAVSCNFSGSRKVELNTSVFCGCRIGRGRCGRLLAVQPTGGHNFRKCHPVPPLRSAVFIFPVFTRSGLFYGLAAGNVLAGLAPKGGMAVQVPGHRFLPGLRQPVLGCSYRLLYRRLDGDQLLLLAVLLLIAWFFILYAVVRHRLLNRKLFVSRKVVYTSLAPAAFAGYLILLGFASLLMRASTGPCPIFSSGC